LLHTFPEIDYETGDFCGFLRDAVLQILPDLIWMNPSVLTAVNQKSKAYVTFVMQSHFSIASIKNDTTMKAGNCSYDDMAMI